MKHAWQVIVAVVTMVAVSAAWAQRSTPVQLRKPNPQTSGDQFGAAVAVDGDTMIVGASGDDFFTSTFTDRGSAYVYRWTGTGWTLEATLYAFDGAAGDQFGVSVAISGDTVMVGANLDNGTFADQGSAYIFKRSGTTWTQQAKLVATDAAAADQFGISVAVSGDTAIVGASSDDVGANANQGSAYVFTRSGSTWTQQAKLTATDGAAGDSFGFSVAISGDTAIVGAYLDDIGTAVDRGSAYAFTRSGTSWTSQIRLTASDGAASDMFGVSVAISGDTVIVGAYLDDVSANIDQGSATVFIRSGAGWSFQQTLTAADGAAGDQFGISVAISGDSAIVGANLDDEGANANQGSASVFVRSAGFWTRQEKLTASGGASADFFGSAVAISGDTAIIGAKGDDVNVSGDEGSSWVFSRAGSKWISDVLLFASDGAASDGFGASVAISADGNTAVIGASSDDINANADQGSVYVFIRSGTVWTQQAKLLASDGAANDFFGGSVAIAGDTVIVGATGDDVAANSNQGSAYVFIRSGSTWTQQAKLLAADGASSDSFGESVSISGSSVIVGADGVPGSTGAAYVFTRSGVTWTQQAKLLASDAASGDKFGSDVSISGNTAIVGASGDNLGTNTDQGSAYVFVRSVSTWTQQAQLTAAGGAAGDAFGFSVAMSGDTAIVGAYGDDVGANVDQGSAYVFTRTGSTWTQQAQLTATGGAASDLFGYSVAISGDTAIVGARSSNENQGSAYVFRRLDSSWAQGAQVTSAEMSIGSDLGSDVALSSDGSTAIVGAAGDFVVASGQGSAFVIDIVAQDLSIVRNESTGSRFFGLASAIVPAASGQQFTVDEAAWPWAGSINTLGRSMALISTGDLRTPSTSVLDLSGSSTLAAAPGSVMQVFGPLRAAGFIDLTAAAFTLGSRGVLTARINSSLTVNSPLANLVGQTRLEQGSSLTFAGTAEATGSTTCAFGSTLTAGTSFTNLDTFTITAGTINTPLFSNRVQFNVFGASAIFGSLLNNAGATTTIRSGTLFVFGDLTNSGTVIGTICSTCSGLPPSMDIGGTLSLGSAANLTMPFVGSTVHLGGSFDCAINANTRFDLAQATLQLQSPRPEVTLEVMSRDIGVDALGLDRSIAGHFPIGELHIGGSPTTVRLVDAHDNALGGTGACEALYVDTLRIDAGSRLINTTCRIYYNTLINGGTVDVPENLIPLQGTPCPADFNMDGGVDGGDVVDFFAAWEGGDSMADVNQDGGVDGGDIDVFFAAWEAGGC
jgi:hypothetical protein